MSNTHLIGANPTSSRLGGLEQVFGWRSTCYLYPFELWRHVAKRKHNEALPFTFFKIIGVIGSPDVWKLVLTLIKGTESLVAKDSINLGIHVDSICHFHFGEVHVNSLLKLHAKTVLVWSFIFSLLVPRRWIILYYFFNGLPKITFRLVQKKLVYFVAVDAIMLKISLNWHQAQRLLDLQGWCRCWCTWRLRKQLIKKFVG